MNQVMWTRLGFLAFLRQVMGDTDAGLSALDEARAIVQDAKTAFGEAWVQVIGAKLDIDLGRPGNARRLVDGIRGDLHVEDWGGLDARLAEIEAEVALATGEDQRGQERFQRALAASERYPYPLFETEFRLRWGRALAARGDPSAAQEHFDAAIASYRHCGFGQRWIDRVEATRKA